VGNFDEQTWGFSTSAVTTGIKIPDTTMLSRDTQIGPLSFNPARSAILPTWLAQDYDREARLHQ
jgi:hypothetical protein